MHLYIPLLAATATTQVAPGETVAFAISLTRRRPSALAEAVEAVSQPESPRFRRYLSDREIAELLEPTGLETVESWLMRGMPSANLTRRAHGSGQVIEVRAPAAEVSTLLGVRLARFGKLIRAGQEAPPPPLAPHVAPHIAAVLGLYDLPRKPSTRPTLAPRSREARSQEADASTSCDFKGEVIDPTVLAKQYGWPQQRAAAPRSSAHVWQGVAAFEDAQFLPSDVAAFEAAYQLPNMSFSVHGPNDGGFFGEASLVSPRRLERCWRPSAVGRALRTCVRWQDTQYIAASGAGVPSWFLAQEAFELASWCEGVLAGVTVLAASGDDGTGSQGSLFHRCRAFDPTYPASCPHVTAVGATYLEGGGEKGWSSSGGGFSALWTRPAWQDAAASTYQSTASLPPASLYNASGRITPDVAALGTCYLVFSGGVATGTLSGTSAATPTFAGMVSRVNDELAASGRPTVGFINPLLYRAGGSVGTDIVDGNNKKPGCAAGFPATAGFDAVTGLGTPLWSRLRQILAA